MRYIPMLLFAFFVIASCKKKVSSSPSTGLAVLNGLSGIKLKTIYDSAGFANQKYIQWIFSGTNPISAAPSPGGPNVGYDQMFLSDEKVTKLEFNNADSFSANRSSTVNIHYNAANLPDTVNFVFNGGTSKLRTYLFNYSGTQLVKITEVSSSGPPYDTLMWSRPVYSFQYIYSGTDVTQLISTYFPTSPHPSPDTIHYTTGTLLNNLSGSFPLFFLITHINSVTNYAYLPAHLPFYLGTHVIDSFSQKSFSNFRAFKYTTDSKSRITQRIIPNDTTFYFY